MMKTFKKGVACALLALGFATASNAAPLTLNGLGLEKTWVDTEAAADEMPDFVWGNASTNLANEIGLYVLFDDGTEGSITWSGVAGNWNTGGGAGFGWTVTSHSGFFSAYATTEVHFLFNTAATTSFPQALPIAWTSNPDTAFGNNVELDYNETLGSEFRVGVTGWVSAEWATYSSTANTSPPIPLPAGGLLLLTGISVFCAARRRRNAVIA